MPPPHLTTACTTDCQACGAGQAGHLYHINGYDLFRCRECGFVFCDPVPSRAELERIYAKPNQYDATAYTPHTNLGRRLKYRLLLRFLGCWFPRSPRIKLLELGCSQGDLLTAAAQGDRFAAVGLDYEKGPVAYARAQGLDARQGDLETSAFPDGSFDAIVAIHVVEHLQDPLHTFREIRRVLRPGGVFFAATPCITHLKARLAGRRWKYLGPPDHLWYFSPRPVRAMARRLGFEVLLNTCFYHRAHIWFLWRKV